MVWNNPNTRTRMLAAFGDGEIDGKEIFDQARDEDDPSEQPAEPVESQEDPAEKEQPKQEEKESYSAEDHIKVLNAQNEAFMNQYQKQIEREFGHLRPQPAPAEEDNEDPYTKIQRELAEVRATQAANQKILESISINKERESFDKAINELSTKYGDLDEFVAKEVREKAYRDAIAGKNFGVDWKDAVAQVYKINSHDRYFSASSKQSDEVANKREEKRQQSLQAAKAVSSGGSQFQPPNQKRDVTSKTFHADRRAAVLAQLGVG